MELKLELDGQSCGVSIFLPNETKPEKKAADELKSIMELIGTVERMEEPGVFSAEKEHSAMEAAMTPDFHKGASIPIGTVLMIEGFVIPQVVGNDINCGIRLYTTDLKKEELECCLVSLPPQTRHIFFGDGCNIPMNGIRREVMLRRGLMGLLETSGEAEGKGIWSLYDRDEQGKALEYTALKGSLYTTGTEGLGDFIGAVHTLSYDDQIGFIGDGNHFVEMQRVAETYDGRTADAWGTRKGSILVTIRSGSPIIGHQSGRINRIITKELYPKGAPHPDNGIYLLPEREEMEINSRENVPVSDKTDSPWQHFCSTTYNAVNFGSASRLFLGLMLQHAATDRVRPYETKLLYGSPHGLIWKEEMEGRNYLIYRRGVCSARGMEGMEGTPFVYYREPVMILGSMGSSNYLLRGMRNPQSPWSASHGVGRRLSGGEAIHGNDRELKESMKKFHVVTPIGSDCSDLKGRNDILKKREETIRSEAPYTYKDIHQVVKVHEEHGVAGLVARVEPVFTVKT